MKPISQTTSLSDKAYNSIKEAILNGELQDNDVLPEEKLAKTLGISRTPLRDALKRLSIEGLIIQKQGSPAVVASFTKERSLEYMEIRSLLEVFNLEKIIDKIDDDFIHELEENLNAQKHAIKEGTYGDFIEIDRDFHLLLASLNDNDEIQSLVHRINTGVNRAFLILSKTVPQSARPAYEEHIDIVEALKERNLIKAKQHMTVHMINVEKRFLTDTE